jgi:hypothetical protein
MPTVRIVTGRSSRAMRDIWNQSFTGARPAEPVRWTEAETGDGRRWIDCSAGGQPDQRSLSGPDHTPLRRPPRRDRL